MTPRINTDAQGESSFRLSEIISALSYALDLTEGQPLGHAVQSCALGMKIANDLQLPTQERSDLYYALLLKDAGCSSNASRMYRILGSDDRAAKRDVKISDWTKVSLDTLRYLRKHVRPGRPARERLFAVLEMAAKRDEQSMDLIKTRCERGADIALKMGFSRATADGILSLDEMWNGKGYPERRRGDEIPLASQVMNLAQTLDVYNSMYGPGDAIAMAEDRSGRWFNPALVKIVVSWGPDDPIWENLDDDSAREQVHRVAPTEDRIHTDEQRLDDICEAFAHVIDAKSPFTYRHSLGVAEAAAGIGAAMGLSSENCRMLRRCGLLHDIGKLSVSNSILEKAGKLDAAEWEVIRQHPLYTMRILEKAPIFQDFAFVASAHHEKLNGAGYHLALTADALPLDARILAVADIYDALAADRPYREGLPLEKVYSIIGADVPHALDADCFEGLQEWIEHSRPAASLSALGRVGELSAVASEPAIATSLEPAEVGARVY